MRSRLLAVVLFALAFPQAAFARGKFDPVKEFEQHDWVSIHLGPLDLSITKAVAYLMLATVLTMLLGFVLMRVPIGGKAGVRQTLGESIYELAQTQIAEQGLPSKAIGRWFPYVASLFLFIFVVPVAAVFYLFEVVIVIGIQAFIFAALSAIYIGSAIEPEH